MHLNGTMLGLAVAPLPGFGILGKVPARFAHLVELKKGVRDKAWTHWMAAPGLVTHNTSHKTKQSVAHGSSGHHNASNGTNKSKIRLTAGASGASGNYAAPSVPSVSSATQQASAASTEASVSVDNATPSAAVASGDAVNLDSIAVATSNTNEASESTAMEIDKPTDALTENAHNNKHKTQFSLQRPAKKLCKRSPFEKGYFMLDTYIED